MQEEALKKAVKIFGSISKLAKQLGLPRTTVNNWLNNNVNIPLEHAFQIERITRGVIAWEELVSAEVIRTVSNFNFPFVCAVNILEPTYISLSRIQHNCFLSDISDINYLVSDIKKHGLLKPICVDSDCKLIFGEKRLHAYELLDKKTIPAFQLSLTDLLKDKYSKSQLLESFTLSERIAIANAIQQHIKKRQGKRTDLILCQNFDEVKGRYDEFIANRLGFGNRQTYHQAKKICQLGSNELIKLVDEKQIAVSTAYVLLKLPVQEQIKVLTSNIKNVVYLASQLRKQNIKTLNNVREVCRG